MNKAGTNRPFLFKDYSLFAVLLNKKAMAQKILSSSGGYFYVNELAVPKGSVYFKRMGPNGVAIYPIEKNSRLVIGSISVAEALNGDDGNIPFTYESLAEWIEMNTAAVVSAGGGTGGGDGTAIDTTNLATRQNQSTQITRESEIRDNVIALLAKVPGNPSTSDGQLAEVNALINIFNKLSADPATQSTLAAVLAKMAANPATSDNQVSAINLLTSVLNKVSIDPATQTTSAAILAKIISNPATSDNQASANLLLTALGNKDFATQATLAALLAKIPSGPSTLTAQNAGNASLASIDAKTPGLVAGATPVAVSTLPLPTNAATESTLNDVKTVLVGGNLKSHVPGMFAFPTTPVQAINSELYNGPVGDAKAFFLAPKNISTSGIIKVAYSMDGINWTLPISVQSQLGNVQTQNIAAPNFNEIYKGPVLGAFIRIYVTTVFTVPTDFVLMGAYDDRAYDLSTFNTTVSNPAFDSSPVASNNGYNTAHKLIAAATTNATLVKNSAAKINWIYVFNGSAAIAYFKIVNASAAPTPGTSLPTYTLPVEAGKGSLFKIDNTKLATGFSYLITAGASDSDATAVAAGVIVSANYI